MEKLKREGIRSPSRIWRCKARSSDLVLLCRDLRLWPCKFASAPSASAQPLLLILHPSNASLIAVRVTAAVGTDDTDGGDGV